MKNLDLEALGVEEMNEGQMVQTEGGLAFAIGVGALIAAWYIYDTYYS